MSTRPSHARLGELRPPTGKHIWLTVHHSHYCSVVKFHNQSLRFLLLPPASDPESTFAVLDGCTTADFVLIGLSSDQEVDRQGETVLRCMTGSGVGASGGVLGVVQVSYCSSPAHPPICHPC